jgi:hypothetical protein
VGQNIGNLDETFASGSRLSLGSVLKESKMSIGSKVARVANSGLSAEEPFKINNMTIPESA